MFGVLSLAVSVEAKAQSWQPIGTDIDHNQFEIDISSINKQGSYVTSWTKLTAIRDLPIPKSYRHYHTSLTQRLDDCSNATVGISSVQYLDDKNRIIQSFNFMPTQIQFTPIVPGSINQSIQRLVCERMARQSSLIPALQANPRTSNKWTRVGFDPL